MDDYLNLETEELLNYLFELGEAKCYRTNIAPITKKDLENIVIKKKLIIEEIINRTY